jgi:hypothetical protein
MALLSREQILTASDIRTEDVEVPEWGGSVRVRALTGVERDAYETTIVNIRSDGSKVMNLRNLRARLVAVSCVDEDGNRLFTDADAMELGNRSASALERVFDVAQKLSGLSASDVEELAEGFGDAPSGDSTSA